MMDGLDLLGAAENLGTQYVTLRVKSVDAEKLKRKLGGAGTMVPSALLLIDQVPKAALDAGLPFAIKLARDDYGVDLEYTVSNVPPAKGGRAPSEFFPGLGIGLVLGGSALGLWHLFARIFGR